MSNHPEYGQPGEQSQPDSTPRRRPNPYAGMYGLPAPEGMGGDAGDGAGESSREAAARDGGQTPQQAQQPQTPQHPQQPQTPQHPQQPQGQFPAAPGGPGPHREPTLQHPYSDSLPPEYLRVGPRTGALDDVEAGLMDAPWYQPDPQRPAPVRPTAANNWLGLNTLGAMWGRGWGLWRRAAGPLTIAFLLFVALPNLPIALSVPHMIDTMTQTNLAAATDSIELQTTLVEDLLAVAPSAMQMMLSSLLLVIGSIPFTNGLVSLARVGSVTMREMLTFKFAVPITVIGLVNVLLQLFTSLQTLSTIYSLFMIFAGYLIVAEGLGLRRAFTRPFSVAVGNMASVLGLLMWFAVLVIGGLAGFGVIGALIGGGVAMAGGLGAGMAVALGFSLLSTVITYPVWLCMVTTTALRGAKRTDFVRDILQRAQ